MTNIIKLTCIWYLLRLLRCNKMHKYFRRQNKERTSNELLLCTHPSTDWLIWLRWNFVFAFNFIYKHKLPSEKNKNKFVCFVKTAPNSIAILFFYFIKIFASQKCVRNVIYPANGPELQHNIELNEKKKNTFFFYVYVLKNNNISITRTEHWQATSHHFDIHTKR